MTSKRPTYLNEGWTSEGTIRRNWARENKRCAFCSEPIPKGRSLYCSRNCSLLFSNDPRYHNRMLLWTKIRAEVLWENKICVNCGKNPASEVDHIKEIAVGGDPFDKANLQALCRQCHKKKTVHFLMQQARIRGRIGQRLAPRGKEPDDAGQMSALATPTRRSGSLTDQSLIEDF